MDQEEVSSSKPRRHRRTLAKDPSLKDGNALDFQAAPRAAQAIRLRRLGYSYEEIAERCGYKDPSGAWHAVNRAKSRIVRDEAEALIGWQLDQIDTALVACMQYLHEMPLREKLWAIDRLVPLLKRQAELMGLDAQKDQVMAAQVLIREYKVPTEAV